MQDDVRLAAFGDAWIFDSPLKNMSHRKFNEVFLVRQKVGDVKGVCKYLRKTGQNEHLWHLLRQEADLSFNQKGLPQTLAFAENENELVLIRNFQPGIPLDQYWKQIPKKEREDFVRTLIEKLIPLFRVLKVNRIVHCDIKPTNLIVSGESNEPEISLIDFGMAVRMDDPAERKTLFALGYSAPELVLNKLYLLNQTTDIFALGISIWHLFTGKLPLMHSNPGIMTNLQITHPLPENKAIPRQINVILQKICYKHGFRKPPHLLDQTEVEDRLKEAMNHRFQDLESVLAALKETGKTNWLDKLLGKQRR